MKILKPLVLGMVFLFGFAVMADEPKEEVSEETTEMRRANCSTTFTICDYAWPNGERDYPGFDACMRRNGC